MASEVPMETLCELDPRMPPNDKAKYEHMKKQPHGVEDEGW